MPVLCRFGEGVQNLEGEKMTEDNFAKRAAKLKAGLTVANMDAQRYREALVEIRRSCTRFCGRCEEGVYPIDFAISALDENAPAPKSP
jgi:hypothetical protein